MNYKTADYLDDLTTVEMTSAKNLKFSKYTATGEYTVPWDFSASYSSNEKYAILNSDFKFAGIEGATYDIFSTSSKDPFILLIYDKSGNVIDTNYSDEDDYGDNQDIIWDFVAPYTGQYFVNASWNQGDTDLFVDLSIYEDRDTATSTTKSSTNTSTSTSTTTGTSTTKGSSSSTKVTSDQVTTQSDSLTVASIVVDGLYKTSTKKFVFAEAGLDVGDALEGGYVPLMSSASKGYVPKGVVAVLNNGDGTPDFLLLKSGTTYSQQLFDDLGFADGGATKLTLAQVLQAEPFYGMDFNGDDVIGDAITKVVDGDGSTNNPDVGLYKTSSGSFIFAEADLAIGDVSESSTLIMSTASKPFTTTKTIVGIAEKDSGYMEILLKSGSKYSAQMVDGETGLVVGSAKTLKAAEVVAREYYYDMDLNGDMIASLVGQTAAPAGWAL
jgi:hypothetical protein